MFVRLIVRCAFVLLPTAAWAQPAPPAAPVPPAPPPPPARELTLDFAFVATTGNTSTSSLGLSGEAIFRPAPWEIRTKAAYLRAEDEEGVNAESIVYLFRASRKLSTRLSAYGQYDYLRDRFAGISQRHAVTGGLSWLAVDHAPHKLELDAGLGYLNEQRLTGDDLSTAVLDLGSRYTWKFSETAELSDELRFNQSLSDGDDWRFGHVIAVSAKLATRLSMKLSHTIRYRHNPPPGFEGTDTTAAIALVAKFAKP